MRIIEKRSLPLSAPPTRKKKLFITDCAYCTSKLLVEETDIFIHIYEREQETYGKGKWREGEKLARWHTKEYFVWYYTCASCDKKNKITMPEGTHSHWINTTDSETERRQNWHNCHTGFTYADYASKYLDPVFGEEEFNAPSGTMQQALKTEFKLTAGSF